MKKIILIIVFLLTIFVSLASTSVYAGGDQVQGDKGAGEVVQDGPCPFGSDTPAGPKN